MKLTDQQFRKAIREAGRNGKTFASADVRRCLGLTTKDRSELTRFQNRFRAFQRVAEDELEKVARNGYRLKKQTATGGNKGPARSVAPAVATRRPQTGGIGLAGADATRSPRIARPTVRLQARMQMPAEPAEAELLPNLQQAFEDAALPEPVVSVAAPAGAEPPQTASSDVAAQDGSASPLAVVDFAEPHPLAGLSFAEVVQAALGDGGNSGSSGEEAIEVTDDMFVVEGGAAAAEKRASAQPQAENPSPWMLRGLLERGQRLGQRVADLFGRA